MNKLVVFIVCIFLSTMLFGQNKVIANITNIKNNEGVCRACLFTNEYTFTGKGSPAYCVVVNVKNKLATAVFSNITPGVYALLVFHDMNNNNKIDKNFFGIPKEGYGASNNKLPFASAPHFDDNKFIVANNNVVSLNIQLRNVF